MRTHYAREKPEADNPRAIVVFQAFVVNESDFLIDDGTKKILVMWLQFARMGKEQVGFPGNQLLWGHFFNPKKYIAPAEIGNHFGPCLRVFPVCEATVIRSFHHYPDARLLFVYPFTLRGGQGNAVIRGSFAFSDQSKGNHAGMGNAKNNPCLPKHKGLHKLLPGWRELANIAARRNGRKMPGWRNW
jgi:hypothetical protein